MNKTLKVESATLKANGKSYSVITDQGKFTCWDDGIKNLNGQTIVADVEQGEYLGTKFWKIKSFHIDNSNKVPNNEPTGYVEVTPDITKLYSMLLSYSKDVEIARMEDSVTNTQRGEASRNVMMTFAEMVIGMRIAMAEGPESLVEYLLEQKTEQEAQAKVTEAFGNKKKEELPF